jgi:hypothetical protein
MICRHQKKQTIDALDGMDELRRAFVQDFGKRQTLLE